MINLFLLFYNSFVTIISIFIYFIIIAIIGLITLSYILEYINSKVRLK